MLFKGLDKLKRNAIMTTIVMMFVGNILLILPEEYIPFLSRSLGFMLLVVLVLQIFHFMGSQKALINYITLTLGLFAGIYGTMLFTFDDLLLSTLAVLVTIVPILLGFYGIYHALVFARRGGRKGWWILIILSGALIVFGSFIYYSPYTDTTSGDVMQILGGTLMFSALISALSLIWIWPIHRD